MAAIALAAGCVSAFYLGLPTNLTWSLLYLPGAAAMIQIFSRSSGALSKLLSLPALVLLGDASFMLYMIHFPLHAVIHIDPLALSVIAIGASVVLHLMFERPAQSLMLRVYRPKSLPRSRRPTSDADPA
jgi:peptidoglycan/LPS O-acetylase OafA/YrhL